MVKFMRSTLSVIIFHLLLTSSCLSIGERVLFSSRCQRNRANSTLNRALTTCSISPSIKLWRDKYLAASQDTRAQMKDNLLEDLKKDALLLGFETTPDYCWEVETVGIYFVSYKYYMSCLADCFSQEEQSAFAKRFIDAMTSKFSLCNSRKHVLESHVYGFLQKRFGIAGPGFWERSSRADKWSFVTGGFLLAGLACGGMFSLAEKKYSRAQRILDIYHWYAEQGLKLEDIALKHKLNAKQERYLRHIVSFETHNKKNNSRHIHPDFLPRFLNQEIKLGRKLNPLVWTSLACGLGFFACGSVFCVYAAKDLYRTFRPWQGF